MNLLCFKKPTRYINNEINTIIKKDAKIKVALAFPDIYEIGMSHLGLKILYQIINSIPYASAERVFAPWVDMKDYLEKTGNPLCSLENNRPLNQFDIIGFSLQYELSYPTVLKMLSLGGVPIERDGRDKKSPLVIAGGPCSVNPLPMESFIDVFLIGDGEEAIVELIEIYKECKTNKEVLLKSLASVEGFYVPGYSKIPVKKRYVIDLDSSVFPTSPPVPYTQIVHDRINIEISRGCSRGCRFCQAGMFYRPLRERTPTKILRLVEESLKNTGYGEVSFTSLSVGDYENLVILLKAFNRRFGNKKISLSLPSLRVGAVNKELLQQIKNVKKTGFTIAPEAATERLRSVINKDFSNEEYENALNILFSEGWLNLKLYFMIGLPTETEEDVLSILEMIRKTLKIAKKFNKKFINITLSLSPFIPKPFTPFQWCGQESFEKISEKIDILKHKLPRSVSFKVHDQRMSLLEAGLCRADNKVAKLIKKVTEKGAYLDGWSELFKYTKWIEAMQETGINIKDIAYKKFQLKESLPWDCIDIGIRKDFLIKEYKKAFYEEKTSDCNQNTCHGCGIGCKSRQYKKEKMTDLLTIVEVANERFRPVWVRIQYSKTGNMKYLSTIELMNTLLRSLRRAGVRLAYSQGYSPFPRISMGPALSVGVEGIREYFDIEVYPPFEIPKMKETINNHLPKGLNIKKMAFIHKKVPSLVSFITRYEYRCKLLKNTNLKFNLFNISKKSIHSEFIEKFDIIGEKSIFLRLQDNQQKKVKLKEVIEKTLGLSMEKLDIIRIALYGFNKGKWIDPMDLLTKEAHVK